MSPVFDGVKSMSRIDPEVWDAMSKEDRIVYAESKIVESRVRREQVEGVAPSLNEQWAAGLLKDAEALDD